MCYKDNLPPSPFLIPFPKIEPQNPLFVEMVGCENCTTSYYITREHSEVSVLCYVTKGEGIIETNGKKYYAGQGDILLLLQGSNHTYYVNQENPWSVLWFNITGELFPQIVRSYHLSEGIVYSCNQSSFYSLFADPLCKGKEETDLEALQQRYQLLIVEIIIKLGHELEPSSYSKQCRQIKQYLDRYLHRAAALKFSLDQMSTELYLSKRHISRITKRELGITPYEYVMQEKANMAKQYLLHTSMSVKEISSALGFCDAYHFSKFYKERFQVAPSRMRENVR